MAAESENFSAISSSGPKNSLKKEDNEKSIKLTHLPLFGSLIFLHQARTYTILFFTRKIVSISSQTIKQMEKINTTY